MNKWLLVLALLIIVSVAAFLVWSSGQPQAEGDGGAAPSAAETLPPPPVRGRTPVPLPTA